MSGGSQDEGQRGGGVLRVLAQAGGDPVDARAAQEAEGGVAEEGHHRGPLPRVEGALVLPERDVLDAVQAVLDGPVAALEREQALGGPSAGERLVIP